MGRDLTENDISEQIARAKAQLGMGGDGVSKWHRYITRDDLPKHLRRYYYDPQDGVFAWFHHPLYVTSMPTMVPKPLEDMVAMREKATRERLNAGDVEGYVFSHERGYRMGALTSLRDDGYFDDPHHSSGMEARRVARRFWKLAAEVWTDAEFPETDPCWTDLMESGIPERGFMTSTDARRALRDMPNWVKIYRGVQAPQDDMAESYAHSGWSWTFSAKTARFFARRFLDRGLHPYVIETEVPKELIAAYLVGRGEAEALIEPGAVEPYEITVQRVSRKMEPRG